ncbi:DNA alkylation repair protein, partial [Patescibacteria group bacterium]|nr:DNA alkylation repair protein [Patescibacteria group bacterium]
MYKDLVQQIQLKVNPQKAKQLQHFFKTGKGEYGEGDRFLGLVVPKQRKIAKQFRNLPLSDCKKLLKSPIHEHRLIALFILIDQFKQEKNQEKIFNLYITHTKYINNWDLVDLSAPYIIGPFRRHKNKSILIQ